MRGTISFLLATGAAGHGMITFPPSRVGGNLRQAAKFGDMDTQTFNNASWFTQNAMIPGRATNCGKYVTGVPCGTRDSLQPWRAPGTAAVFSPCGGFCLKDGSDSPNGCEIGGQYDEKRDGRDLPESIRTEWQAGGYAWRLCPVGEKQTEKCFQQTHLDFASENTTVYFTTGKKAQYPAVTMSTGTYPAGSQWRTIRIPSCSTTTPSICGHELLPQPCADCCAHDCDRWHYSLIDSVTIPATLKPGDYTLSWRWDAEINHQVWQGCADVTIVRAAAPTPPPPPPPAPTPPTPTPPAPTPPSPSPAPASGNECQQSKGCNVCQECCGNIPDGQQCDTCVQTHCRQPKFPTPPPTPEPTTPTPPPTTPPTPPVPTPPPPPVPTPPFPTPPPTPAAPTPPAPTPPPTPFHCNNIKTEKVCLEHRRLCGWCAYGQGYQCYSRALCGGVTATTS